MSLSDTPKGSRCCCLLSNLRIDIDMEALTAEEGIKYMPTLPSSLIRVQAKSWKRILVPGYVEGLPTQASIDS